MDNVTEKIRNRYDRAARFYDFFESPMEMMALSSWRKALMSQLKGKVLEVGVGTGKNIDYYPPGMDITAIDFSQEMLKRAKAKADAMQSNVKLLHMDVQNLDFEDNTFDMVFTTCVFCSVPDPVQGLKELRRVCKPNGKIIMIEHVRSENNVMGLIMDVFNPVVVSLYGANINRRTADNVKAAGFSQVEVVNLVSDIVKKIVILNLK